MIKTQDLTKAFDHIEAVKGLGFEIAEGEIFGLIGPNGAGKTTTARLLTGIVKPTVGDAWVAGCSIREEMAAIRRVLGMVPEGTPLFRRLTARETIRFFGRLHGIEDPELAERIAALAAEIALEDHLDRANEGLSLGTKKKVLFASAMLHEPQVLVCDEPTLGLDPRATLSIIELLSRFKQRGKAVLLTSHNMEMIDRICDRIAVIHKGEIRVVGPPAEIKRELAAARDQKEVELDEVFLHYTAA